MYGDQLAAPHDASRSVDPYQLPRHYWRGERGGPPPGARLAEDFVHDAVVRALERRSEWSDVDSLQKLMRDYILHRISRLSRKQENKDIRLDTFMEDTQGSTRELSTEAETSSQYGPQPGGLFPAEAEIFKSQVRQRAHQRLTHDAMARTVFDLMEEGITEPRNISKMTGLPAEVVYVLKKRVHRNLSAEFKELQPSMEKPPLNENKDSPEEE